VVVVVVGVGDGGDGGGGGDDDDDDDDGRSIRWSELLAAARHGGRDVARGRRSGELVHL